jgi:hypothetical protein
MPDGHANVLVIVAMRPRERTRLRAARPVVGCSTTPRKPRQNRNPGTVKTLRAGIRASQQARILDRDVDRCVQCAPTDELTIGHLLAIEDGVTLGASADELNCDANRRDRALLASILGDINLGSTGS